MAARESRKGTSRFKVKNWKEYEASLVKRGRIDFWIHEDAISQWKVDLEVKNQGAQPKYSDLAIQTCLTFRSLFRLPLRQTEGFIDSLFELMHVDLSSPDHTTLSRRSGSLTSFREKLKKLDKEDAINVLIDSTGLKMYGSGEWEEFKHGKGRKSGWMKLHLGVDEESKEIVASILTDHLTSDMSQVDPLLEQVEEDINDVKADGAYEYESVLEFLKKHEIQGKGIFPPPKNAILSENWKADSTQRDLNILRIYMDGRDIWEYASGYSKRNLAENAMFRYKNYFGSNLKARTSKNQEAETNLEVHLLNQMTRLGMPKSERIR